jgi:cytochrome c peroxidase
MTRRGFAAWCALALTTTLLQAGMPALPLGLDRYRPVPEDNPLTEAKVALGRRLFRERRFSRDGATSCATCHDPRQSFADHRPVAVGAAGAVGRRNAPALLNRAWGASFFWDGRAATLEQQVLEPLMSPLELGATAERVVSVISAPDYAPAFRRAFNDSPSVVDVTRAIAAYLRTIVAAGSPFDRHVAGDRKALSAAAARGKRVFEGAACQRCHAGTMFSDELFHNTGIAWRGRPINTIPSRAADPQRPAAEASAIVMPTDIGRFAVTGIPEDRGAFKTPTLRNVAQTAPYMHDGSFTTLEDVVEYYNQGGQANSGLDHRLRPLYLSAGQRTDLVSFLHALTGRVQEGW